MGLIPLQEGSVTIDGMKQQDWLKLYSFGYLPQREEYDRTFPATALDIVLMGIAGTVSIGRRCSKTQKAKALEIMQQCGIDDKVKSFIGTLSGGEFQRVMLARAILSDSPYLILDEPEAGIDRPGVQSFFVLLKQLNEAGKTIITISHDLHTLSDYCSFLICLNRTLHCHSNMELVNADIIHKTFGDSVRLIEKLLMPLFLITALAGAVLSAISLAISPLVTLARYPTWVKPCPISPLPALPSPSLQV